jgi:putative redox protein
MIANVKWVQGMTFEGKADSGFQLRMGTSPEFGGADDGLRPMELLLIGLAGCTGMDVISIMQKKQQKVAGFEIKVSGQRSQEHPKVFTEIQIEYVFKGEDLDPAAIERSIELSETKYCSVMAMLRKASSIMTSYKIEK